MNPYEDPSRASDPIKETPANKDSQPAEPSQEAERPEGEIDFETMTFEGYLALLDRLDAIEDEEEAHEFANSIGLYDNRNVFMHEEVDRLLDAIRNSEFFKHDYQVVHEKEIFEETGMAHARFRMRSQSVGIEQHEEDGGRELGLRTSDHNKKATGEEGFRGVIRDRAAVMRDAINYALGMKLHSQINLYFPENIRDEDKKSIVYDPQGQAR